ncbi:hypothetical protein KSC_021610 [Ktedonobacter sp. SOSP1-52]|uniref:YtxH domain-containing protein n=1 Tax=Ktedonobacter sp. SOSP1-52 TaxID=2778366 RepID=UPI00191645AB|nr:YtxH domain-containing protein [Ktedonobacter sp. SOSP1-52]GHO63269.1 hypothetical protein KSC_021610 [Ktedonobacter sp. SOSP1-52]
MGSFTNGVLAGLGLSLFFAPKKGEEIRHLVGERLGYLRGHPPENVGLQQSVHQMGQQVREVQERAAQASQMSSAAHDAVQETMNRAEVAQRDLDRLEQDTHSE